MAEQETWKWQEMGTAWKGVGIYHVTLVVPSREALLGRLVIPDKIGGAPVCEILGEAFAGCSNVTEIVIPASVEKIDDYYHPWLFVPCRSLERISVSPENSKYCSIDGVLFGREYMSLLAYPQRSRAAIPPHTDGISSRAFARNENIERADIPPAPRRPASPAATRRATSLSCPPSPDRS